MMAALVSFAYWITVSPVSAAVLAYTCCRLMMRTGVVDAPDGERKLQAYAVPRLGGAGIFLAGMALFAISLGLAEALPAAMSGVDRAAFQPPLIWVALGFALAAALIGLLDDLFALDARLKLALLLAACLAAPALGLLPASLLLPWGFLDGALLLGAGAALWLLVFTNAANFMDGANGLSIGTLLVMQTGLVIIAGIAGNALPHPAWLILLGAVCGFLALNLRGRLYAGDCGALGLGGLFAASALASGLSPWTIATLALPFLADVLLTLIWRTRHARALMTAHTDHAYQRLIARGWSHIEAAALYWMLAFASALAALIGALGGGALSFALFWSLAGAFTVLWWQVPRSERQRDRRDLARR